MNLAILIGVSEYKFISKLKMCDQDLSLISDIVDISEKYNEVLLLNNSPTASTAKVKIAEFIRVHQSSDIDEIFIYYTGHGTRIKDDFFYLFSDFDEQKLEQTSLRNSEFDAMLKSLKPKLTVKVIDACQAGTEYIKSNQELQMIFDKSSKDSFNKAYFLFSSSSIESSIALQDFSVFTKSFAESLLNHEGKNIRYRDVMAYISDDVNVKKHQTPLFIQQADNTEIFVNVSEEMIEMLMGKINLSENSEDLKDTDDDLEVPLVSQDNDLLSHLVKRVKTKGENFCSQDEARASIEYLKEILENYKWKIDISEHLFNIEYDFNLDVPYLTSRKEIAKWLSNTSEEYFIALEYEKETYETEVPETNIYRMAAGAFRTITGQRDILKSFRVTAVTPFQTLVIQLEPNEQILNWYKIFITLVFSKSKLTIFYKYEKENNKNWNERFIKEQNEWQTVNCNLKSHDEIKDSGLQLMTDIENQIISDIQRLVD